MTQTLLDFSYLLVYIRIHIPWPNQKKTSLTWNLVPPITSYVHTLQKMVFNLMNDLFFSFSIGLDHLIELFKKQFLTLPLLKHLTEDHLKEIGVTELGTRLTLIMEIGKLKL